MKKAVFLSFVTVLLCSIFLLTVCEPNNVNKSGDDPIFSGEIFNEVKVNAKELIAPDGQDLNTQSAANGANDFAFRLGAELLNGKENINFVYSPFSVWLPLAALANAAREDLKPALINALSASGISEADLNKAASRMLWDLTKSYNRNSKDYFNPLRIANAVFVDKSVTLRTEFAQTFMDYFRGSSINVDFSSPDAVTAVNRWASENTEGLIKEVIKEFNKDTVTAIANAIYFSDRWEWEFNPTQTKEDDFNAPSGKSKALYMLREGGSQLYYEDSKVQAISLSFTQGAGMYIILPRTDSAENFLSSMKNEYFKEIHANAKPAKGKLLLPRFSIENDISDLKEALIALGIPLFDFEPITNLIKEASLFISSAKQKALIKVDEKGTTAAAVTVMGMDITSMPPEPQVNFEMICNRPFIFILYDHTYDGGNQILFTGIVNKP